MKNIKNYKQFNESLVKNNNEAFTIKLEQLPSIGDIVDKVDWREGEKIAFIDFKGIKNIPVHVSNNIDEFEVDTNVD